MIQGQGVNVEVHEEPTVTKSFHIFLRQVLQELDSFFKSSNSHKICTSSSRLTVQLFSTIRCILQVNNAAGLFKEP